MRFSGVDAVSESRMDQSAIYGNSIPNDIVTGSAGQVYRSTGHVLGDPYAP